MENEGALPAWPLEFYLQCESLGSNWPCGPHGRSLFFPRQKLRGEAEVKPCATIYHLPLGLGCPLTLLPELPWRGDPTIVYP